MAHGSRLHFPLLLLGMGLIGLFVVRAVLQYAGRGVDFQWDGAYLLLQGQNPYTATVNQAVVEPRLLPISALYFPSAMALLIPYALFPYEVARWLWLFTNLLLTLGSIALLFHLFAGRRATWQEWVVMGLVVVGSAPWAIGIGIGQHAIFSLFFFLLALWCARQQRQVWAGVALAIAAFKYVLVVPLALYFVYKRWYRALVVAALIHLGLHSWTAVQLGVAPLELLWQPLALSQQTHALGGYVDLIALQRYLGYGLPAVANGVAWWGIGSVLILGLLTVWAGWKRPRNGSVYLATLCWLGMIALYHPHYDLIFLLIPLFLFFYRRADFDPLTQRMGVVGIGALFFLNRLTSALVTVLPAEVAAGMARLVLIALFGIYYAVAIRLVVVLLKTDSSNESDPLFLSSQGGA